FDQRGERDSLHGRVAIGWLVIEDLLTVFILILVPLLASQGVGNSSAEEIGEAVGVGMAQVVTFSAGMMLIGNRVAPQLLLLTARLNSRELRLVTVLALALGVGYGASTLFDVSYALGAFLAGLVVSEAEISHQAAADALPLQDAFAALFFVSVGMLFDPRFLLEEPVLVAVVVLLIVVAKPVITQLLLSALRFPDRPGLLISASRAQIGEFSFILGSIGMAEGLINDGQMSLILAGSIISIVLSPLIFNSAGRISMRITGGLSLRLPGREFTLEPAPHSALHEHAVILGGGRVGGLIITEMLELEIPVIVADYRRDVIDRLRAAGVPVIYGDVANPQLLRHLHLECARVLVVAISDELAARLAVERARQIRPDLPIVVRTHTEHERLYLDNLPYTEAVMGEREMAVEMASFALRQFGLSLGELDAVEQDMRSRSSDEPLPGQPLPLEGAGPDALIARLRQVELLVVVVVACADAGEGVDDAGQAEGEHEGHQELVPGELAAVQQGQQQWDIQHIDSPFQVAVAVMRCSIGRIPINADPADAVSGRHARARRSRSARWNEDGAPRLAKRARGRRVSRVHT